MIGKSFQGILILVVFGILMGACGTVLSPSDNHTPEPTPIENIAYPGLYADVMEDSAYPVGNGPVDQNIIIPESIDIPTPSKDSGVVIGRILVEGSREAYLGANLLLGEVVEADQPGYPPLIGFSEQSNPKAVIAKDGSFLFINVPPGKYGLVMTNLLSTSLIENPETGESLIISVDAGELIDLGELFVK